MLTRFLLGSILATGLIVFTACSSSDSGAGAGNDAGAAETSTVATGDSGGGGGGGTVPTGGACDGTDEGAEICTGELCLSLNENKQNKAGICTAPCSATVPCAAGTTCVQFPNIGLLCLKDCQTNADCTDGFICLDAEQGDGTKFCFVETTQPLDGGADAGDAGDDYCKAQDCDILPDPKGYCDNNTAAKRVCDCPSGKTPNAACTAATTGANLWCCPAAP